jgi:hypothetical protein
MAGSGCEIVVWPLLMELPHLSHCVAGSAISFPQFEQVVIIFREYLTSSLF